MIKDKRKKKKVNAPSDKKNTNQKKGSVQQDEDNTKKKKTNTTEEWKWENREKPMTEKKLILEARYSSILIIAQHPLTCFKRLQE